jgi:hypothetical protein
LMDGLMRVGKEENEQGDVVCWGAFVGNGGEGLLLRRVRRGGVEA